MPKTLTAKLPNGKTLEAQIPDDATEQDVSNAFKQAGVDPSGFQDTIRQALGQGNQDFGSDMAAFPKISIPTEAQQRLDRLDQLSTYRDSLDPAAKDTAKVTTEIDKERKALVKAFPQIEQTDKQKNAASDARAAMSKLGIFANKYNSMQENGSLPLMDGTKFPLVTPGILRGVDNWVEGKLQTNPVEPAFNGGKTEMAASLAKLITGGSRPTGEITEGLIKSLPGDFSSRQTFAQQLGQQFENAMAQRAADENIQYDPNAAREMIAKALKKYLPEGDAAQFEQSYLGKRLNPQPSQNSNVIDLNQFIKK